jgi:hypothetical protein
MTVQRPFSNAKQQLIRLSLRLNSTLVIFGFLILMVMWSSIYKPPLLLYSLLVLPGSLLLISWFNYVPLACVFLDEFVPRDIPERKFASTLKALEAETYPRYHRVRL